MSTHPVINRLARKTCEELSIGDVVDVLNRSRAFVQDIIRTGDLASIKESARAGKTDKSRPGKRHQYIITRADVVAYLIKKAQGDKSALLHAIQEQLPRSLYNLAQALSQPKPAPAPAREDMRQPAKPAPRIKAPVSNPFADQLELFT